MSMSTHVVGFVPPDDEWKAKKAAWDACKAAGVEPPTEIAKFFNWEKPDDHGREVTQSDLEKLGAVKSWRTEMSEGYEIEIAKLPPNVKVIRVFNSW